jgi:uncharacterized protein
MDSARYAMITGASGGLGGAFALEAARRGWNLVLVDLPDTGLEELGRRLRRCYRIETKCLTLDIADGTARASIREWVEESGIALGLLVNNAGTGCHASFDTASLDTLAGIVSVNVQATVQLTHLLLPALRRQVRVLGRGRRQRPGIINVASLAAFYPMPAMAVYAASKSFILNFTLALREELHGEGVLVSALCPAGMLTNRDTVEQVRAQGFFGRITTWRPEEVAVVALRQAARGKAVIIPGIVNRLIKLIGAAVPRSLVVRCIGRRWREAENALRPRGEVSPVAV